LRRASWDDLPNILAGQEFETVLTNGVFIRARALAFSAKAAEVEVRRTSDKALIPARRQPIPRELFRSVTVRRRKGPARALLATVCTLGGMLATTAIIGRGGFSESEPGVGDVAVILSVGAGAGILGYYWGARIDDQSFTVVIQPVGISPP
jgi:hypothetical protein